ncbi:MAG: hypothetical protein WAN86_08920 [Hyphomicrobiaceae bacterium]
MAESADNTLMLEILKDIRKEQNNQRTLLLLTVDAVRRLQQYTEEKFLHIDGKFLHIEERMKAHKDDLELMLKSELLGAMTQFQTRIENYVEQRLAEKAE